MNLYGIRLKEDDIFGKVHHAALTLAALLSGALFTTDLPWWGWLSSILNLIALILGMVSHKMSLITIFGHKHFRQKFIKNLTFFTKNFNSL